MPPECSRLCSLVDNRTPTTPVQFGDLCKKKKEQREVPFSLLLSLCSMLNRVYFEYIHKPSKVLLGMSELSLGLVYNFESPRDCSIRLGRVRRADVTCCEEACPRRRNVSSHGETRCKSRARSFESMALVGSSAVKTQIIIIIFRIPLTVIGIVLSNAGVLLAHL